MTGPVAVTGWAVHLDAADARQVLGRKGLLAKEPATRLALCAVHRALGCPDGARPDRPLDPGTAVVVSSNLGNIGTVAEVTRVVARDGGRAVSPLTAPNASSNVIAGAVALWFRFGGPNLMLCSGEAAGLDAVVTAVRLLRAGRARRVVVAGAEPDDPDAAALRPGLRAGAACVVLEPVDRAAGPRLLPVAPDGGPSSAGWAGHYGARGVLQVAEAAGRVAAGGAAVTVRLGDRAALLTGATS